jgi:NAD+ synthase (glutamine-hydrolysing)
MKIAAAQLNPTVGDLEGNLRKLTDAVKRGAADGADLVVFPELFLTGYPPKDLLERADFIGRVKEMVQRICLLSLEYPEVGVLFGAPLRDGKNRGGKTFNTAMLVSEGKVAGVQHKSLLPTYDVFDESRYFDHAEATVVITFKGEVLGISICEDAWNDPVLWPGNHLYTYDPIEHLAQKGASLLINISASPFSIGKETIRYRLIAGHAKKHHLPFLYVNQIGGNDELIFDGRSLFVDAEGTPVCVLPAFREKVQMVDTSGMARGASVQESEYAPQDRIESVFEALILGTRDYMAKSGFSKAVVGLSGGIDSSVTVCIAVQALGRENVLGVAMPSPFSSRGSIEDATRLAENLGISFKTVGISDVYQSYLDTLKDHFAGKKPDITEENIQARIRGNLLMAFSNKFGYLVLSTGNKSELAVGYCTLYGDMSGGLGVISDVPKNMVYELARHINRKKEIIPQSTIDKPPSAELKPNQKDQDSLPPYETLDEILYLLIEEGISTEGIIERGFEPETVRWVAKTVQRSEYKRKQAAPGLRVTSKAFGIGRRFPIAARYEL